MSGNVFEHSSGNAVDIAAINNIPILGYLFRNRTLRTANQELMIFVTPRIIKG